MSIRIAKILFLGWIIAAGCGDSGPVGNNPPSLSYIGLEKDTMRQGLRGDSVVVLLNFEDVDGDLGGEEGLNISIVDNRDGFVDPVSFPILPKLKDGQRGLLRLTIETTCCIFPNNIQPCENPPEFPTNRYTYDIVIKDIAGNVSNAVTTDSITLLCL